ncbi:hypothetical protein [Micromonospora sp. WMMD980]|uniref:hypothetical protein n=1 Tax=Micromonospora sp. WMMD980 TaxID=3016088 RepID=UPI002417EA72|nr:hypothetical protein [Micromonospora sp. WMMD980]MDG4798991.1 hypothetical protein [Micromonospora sp. WMMD980]MDG4799005.1 hypothetical protein [Micromonospora sp. WMMD980]MDG4799071.1 hypothetical protein [Micromonospora sp. WMMD980]
MTPAQYVLMIVVGGTGTPLLVAEIARRLVEGHANTTARAIREQQPAAPARAAAVREKELTR